MQASLFKNFDDNQEIASRLQRMFASQVSHGHDKDETRELARPVQTRQRQRGGKSSKLVNFRQSNDPMLNILDAASDFQMKAVESDYQKIGEGGLFSYI